MFIAYKLKFVKYQKTATMTIPKNVGLQGLEWNTLEKLVLKWNEAFKALNINVPGAI